jgi:hypothetical protein
MGQDNGIKRFLQRHFKIIDLVIEGKTDTDIAKELGMSRQQVCNITNSPAFQHQLSLRREKSETVHDAVVAQQAAIGLESVQKKIADAASDAAQAIIKQLGSESEVTVRRAAQDILDRAGYVATRKVETSNKSLVVVMDEELLKRLEKIKELDKD